MSSRTGDDGGWQPPIWEPRQDDGEPAYSDPAYSDPAYSEPQQRAPIWEPSRAAAESAWDAPDWWRGEPRGSAPGGPPPQPGHAPGGPPQPRRRGRTAAVAGGIFMVAAAGVAVALFLQSGGAGAAGATAAHTRAATGFRPTAAGPAAAAQQTAQAFLSAWEAGDITKAASYTDAHNAAQAGLTSYRDGLHLRSLHVTVTSAADTSSDDASADAPGTSGTVDFDVKASVGLPPATTTGTWSYQSSLTAYEKKGAWWVRWAPGIVDQHLTYGQKLVTAAVAPPAATASAADGTSLASSGDPGIKNITADVAKTAAAKPGEPGLEVQRIGADGTPVASSALVLTEPVAAQVTTTIDAKVQAAAESAVQANDDSSMVVIQPSTGRILAVANNDGYNDYALTARVAPGSTNKIITATALLASGLVSSPAQAVTCPAQLVINGDTFTNDKGESEPAGTPFQTDFAASCNNAFAQYYSSIGATTLAQTAQKYYGLDQPWDIGIGSAGTYYSMPGDAYNGELAQELFGQGQLEAAPLAMASVAATVDTGTFRQPIVVPGEQQAPATPLPDGVRSDLWQMMSAVTQAGGTAAGVFDSVGSAVYAKTGTADVGGQQQPNSWMVAFDPTLDVAVGCVVLNAGYGAAVAGPEAATALRLIGQS